MKCLSTYVDNLARFNFISAKNNIKFISVEENVLGLNELLNQVINVEKNYFNLNFVSSKHSGILGRKRQSENYACVKQQIIEVKGKSVSTNYNTILNYVELLTDHRCSMMKFYRMVASLKNECYFKVLDCLPDLIAAKNSLKSQNIVAKNNPLDSMFVVLNLEVDILLGLLEAHEKTTNLYFLDPLNSMQAANRCLNQLEQIHRNSESQSVPLQLINWMKELNQFTLDKYTLYFQPILSRYSILTTGYSATPDSFPLVDKIRQFAQKQNPCTVILLFDTTQQTHAYTGHGYVLPRTRVEPLIGLQNYQAIFSTSANPLSQDDLCLVVSIIRHKLDEPNRKYA